MKPRDSHSPPVSVRSSSGRRLVPAFFFPALILAVTAMSPCARSMGSLPTGPSERGNESEIARSSGVSDMLPAQIRLLADREFQAILAQEISTARTEIVLSVHLFTALEEYSPRPRTLAELLIEAARRGVEVIVVLEIGREVSPVTAANRRTAGYLAGRGVRVYADMSGTIVHSKLAVIDRQLVFIGSHDLTQQSLGRHRETTLVVDSPALATSVLSFIESLDPVTYQDLVP